jgi:rod shape-determining protein MreC
MARAVRSGTRVDTALLAGCVLLALLLTVLPLDRREAIAAGLRRTVVAPLVALQAQAERSRSAFLSREATTYRVDSLALRTMQLAAMEQENERLRRLLGLARSLGSGFVIADALHGSGVGLENTVTLTAGANAGVIKDSPVIAPEGVVGRIQTNPDPNLSTAILWTHTDFRVSAMSADGSAFGIVSAHNVDSEPEKYLMELRGVAFRSALKPGTLIVSSGLGGVWPQGINIGTVLSELRTSEGWARTYLLRPAVRPPDVTSVMILLPRRAQAGVSGIWRSPASADSAARAAAAAGDSLARGDSLAAAVRAQAAARSAVERDSAPLPPINLAKPPASQRPDSVRRPRTDSVRKPSP